MKITGFRAPPAPGQISAPAIFPERSADILLLPKADQQAKRHLYRVFFCGLSGRFLGLRYQHVIDLDIDTHRISVGM